MKPTIGRIVIYKPPTRPTLSEADNLGPSETFAAIITRVHSDGSVDLTVFPPRYCGSLVRELITFGNGPNQWSCPVIEKK